MLGLERAQWLMRGQNGSAQWFMRGRMGKGDGRGFEKLGLAVRSWHSCCANREGRDQNTIFVNTLAN